MDNNYFDYLRDSINEPSENKINDTAMATLTIKVDIDAKIYCDGDFLDLVEANVVKKIPIEVGQHLITIESENVEGVSEDREVDFKEAGKNYLLIVKGLDEKECVSIREEEEHLKIEEENALRIEEEKPLCTIGYKTTTGERLEHLFSIFHVPIRSHEPSSSDERYYYVTFCEPIYSIPNSAFSYNSSKIKLVSVELPSGIEIIGEEAFLGQSELVHVGMPNTIKEIGRAAFKDCSSLEKSNPFDDNTLSLPKDLVSIGVDAFSGCEEIKHILFGECVIELDQCCFYGCKNLRNVTLPDSIKVISIACFKHCTSLRDVYLGSGIQKIYTLAFGECINLETVTFSSFKCPQINPNCFYNCGKFVAEFACKVDKESYRACEELIGKKNWGLFNLY